jgi:outer membrane protein
VQAGIDIPINDQGFGISFDAKRYFLSTTAHWYNAAGTQVLSTRHKLDPWVVSGGVSYRF